jgi:uncharacterized protein YktA (UPF0223 family)
MRIIREQRTAPVDAEQESSREWLKVLSFMWEAIGKSFDANATEEKQFDAYVHMFGMVPLAILEKGVMRAIANNGVYKVIPAPGAIWQAIRKDMELSASEDVFEAMQTWEIIGWDRCVIRLEAQNANS